MHARAFRWLFCLLMVALFINLPRHTPSAGAQSSEGLLRSGEAVTGTIDNTNHFDVWEYQASGNETIDVFLEATSGNLDPSLIILSSRREVFAMNDDINTEIGDLNSAVTGLYLPNPGTVLVIVSRFGALNGSTAGDYRLELSSSREVAEPVNTQSSSTRSPENLDPFIIQQSPEAAFDYLRSFEFVPAAEAERLIYFPAGLYLEGLGDQNFLLLPVLTQNSERFLAADFVLHSNIQWQGEAMDMACGVGFRAQVDSGDTYLLNLKRSGSLELVFVPEGDGTQQQTLASWVVAGLRTGDMDVNNLLLIANGSRLDMFINYQRVATYTDSTLVGPGLFTVSLSHDSTVPVFCTYEDYWLMRVN
jgi:hypothetical protein